ncbi:MAG: amino acid adenylation domain-containing protein [Alphaproteobacteria bacterium]|nr:amino acid adenylation domain-containing protein [Alphaproteobacteria bacterium]
MNTAQELRDIEDAILEAGSAQRTTQEAQRPAQASLHAPMAEPIAIVGLSGFFPGCQSVDQFWQALDRDASLIEEIPPSRFDWRTAGGRSRWGGFIPDIAGFDPAFFGIPPGEAVTMDPRQRLLLMSAYQTLGDAGYAPRSLKRSRTGVFVAIQDNEYLKLLEAAGIDTGEWYAQTSLLANRLSYFFDFRGASEVVDAQCPGAAVAIHRAVSALRLGELDQALVGAANLLLTPEPFALLSESGQLSPTDSVNSFGSRAQGHLRSEGVASVLLKPLSRALADNDHVYALIRSTAVNYNGQGGASIAAPNLESHVEVIKDCYRRASIDPRHVRYIEAQGMGNVLADLVEWRAFNRALGELAQQQRLTLEPGACRVSTVKPMMGHMESASALGALFKVVRSLESGVVHKVAAFTDYHPEMEREGEPCAIAEQTAPWLRTGGARLAGVHCYGMGGINAHLLIEEFEPVPREREPPRPALIVLSARSEASLATMVREFLQHLRENTDEQLGDIAFTLQVGREELEHRLAWVVASRQELIARLQTYLADPHPPAALAVAKDELQELATRWLKGGAVAWASLHEGRHPKRVRLPVYPFDKQPYWIGRERERAGTRDIKGSLVAMLGEALQLPPGAIDGARHLYDFGIDSLLGMKLLRGLARRFDIEVQARDLIEHPTIEALAAHLGRKLPKQRNDVPGPSENAVLSEGQKGLWALQQLAPAMSAYNIPLCFHIAQPVDVGALKAALRRLLDEHPMLASRFVEQGASLVREARRGAPVAFEHEDIAGFDADRLLARIASIVRRPFDLAADVLVRARLLSRGPRDHHLLITLHHIVFDGGSFVPVCRGLFSAYQDILEGKAAAAAAVEDLYPQFVAWERQMLAGAEGARHRAYWMGQLTGSLPVMSLFTDFPRAASRPFAGQSHSVRLDPVLSRRLRTFARQQRMTLSTLFLALFKVVLHRYSGQDDIVVGMAERGRSQERFESAVGYFINMLPIRTRDVGSKPFADLLRELQLTMADALDHAAYPFARMVRDLGIMPDDGIAPVFQVAFEYQNAFSNGDLLTFNREFGEALGVTLMEEVGQEGEYELVLEVREGAADFLLNVKFNPTLFKSSTIAALAGHLMTAAEQAMARPDRLSSELEVLPARERKLLIEDWNRTDTDYLKDQCVHQLFAQQVLRTPRAVALVCDEHQLSYAELDARSTSLAKYLQRRGVLPEQIVAVCVERSLDMVVALLAVAKAGAAWLPLDPRFPAERLRFMLDDSRASLVLTQSAIRPMLTDVAAISLDTEWDAVEERASGVDLREESDASHLAYVIYTSGSTGVPKGVMVEHRALTNFLCSMAKRPGLAAGDRLLAVTTYSFDIAALELLLPLVRGGTCLICPASRAGDADLLRQEIRQQRPTVMQATPSTWTMLFASGWRNEERMKLLCGGEPLPPALKQQFVASRSEAWNMFGPTETTIWSTVASITGDDAEVSIGTPIANTQIHILDRYGRLVPRGVPGELCIGGDGLARGYLGNPALTAERFIANPFRPGTRLYRTGDLARWREDGALEHLGRLDHQVKIRGHRVELEEIETRLDRHASVVQSVVVARAQQGSQQLVAYYVAKGRPATPVQLKEHLARHLPDYMIPAFYVVLPELPLTANGKTDRKALAAREPVVQRVVAAPVSDSRIEQALLGMWRTLLDIGSIDVDDRFFELGGNSVTAVILARQIGDRFGVEFRAPDLFRYPTVREIARLLARPTAPRPAAAIPDVKERPRQGDGAPGYYRDSLAIVGISCHLPGARTPAQFWENLRQGKESSTPLSLDELRRAGVSDEVLRDPNFVPLQYSMESKDLFDPAFFNISPKNAVFMDPQFRVLLQHAWQAIEDAGYAAQSIPDTAVFMSASNGFYKTLLHTSGTVEPADEYAAWIAGQGGTIPTMVSYQLGFKGPSLSVHSNCSSSLVALYLANQALQAGEARCALVGAASLFPIPGAGHFHLPGMNLSSDGHCRTFDAAADGLVGGEGVAVVMLKKALDAIEDGDHIYALVRGVAVNNDGSDKAGFYAPSVAGQAAAIDKVLTATGIDPDSIGYVEAHGTGTRLGDPIEVMALNEVYRRYTDRKQFCRIGSVKPNIGHLDTAAGLAGIIKVALSLRHGEIPPSINYSTPNPDIDFASSAFSVADRLSPWPETGEPRRAAVSSFGIGGTNAHAVLEEYRAGEKATTGSEQLIVLSARTEEQLKTYASRLLEHVRGADGAQLDLQDMAFTLQTGRKPMAWRAVFQARTLDEIAGQLERFVAGVAAEGCFRGHVRPAGEAAPVADKEDADHLVARWLSNGRLDKLAMAWAGGLEFDWSVLHRDGDARRISLPTYPFAEERYWVEAGSPMVRASTNLLLAYPVWKHRPVEAASPPVYERRVRLEPKPSGATPPERYRSLCVQVFEALKPAVSELGVRTLFQVVYPGGEERSLYAGLAGLLKTARLENPGVVAQLIEADAGDAAARLDENARCPDDVDIRYEGRQRLVLEWEMLPDTATPNAPWKEGGVYLLTGGVGALALIFAEEIARQVSSATLVLAHRSDLAARWSARIDALRSKGVAVVLRKCDLSRKDEVDALVAEIVAAHGTIDGILHCAGMVRDNWILKKPVAELETVLAAKVDGVVNLDRAARDLDLDFFVSFSSAATVHGSAGQADYCAANAFLDAFTGHDGRAITIDWPLWRDGGMRPDAASEQAMREVTGLVPLSTSSGIQAFYRSLASGRARVLVLEGDSDAIPRWLAPGISPTVATAGPETLSAGTIESLKRLIAQAIRMPAERIDPSEPLGTYGIDSIAIVRLNQQLEKIFGRLPKTLFFQFQTIEALVGYLLKHHGDGCAAWAGQDAVAPPMVMTPVARAVAPVVPADDPIAIIGIAGRYPQADTLDAFWENLKAGRDCIGEIPPDRWPMDGFFEADPKKAAASGRSYSRWGGFLDDFADFDPLFFNISPKEALAIDPQERLFLQCAWHALEDAGYTRDSLQELNRRNVGVFVGVTKTGFELHGPELWRQGKLTFPHTSFSSVANRVSYCLNLRGPSMPIDTMCSASLTAIHEACQHIRHGDCDMAIAGGVNLYLHPSSYVGLCSVYMLSKDGQCRSFGEGGNGFVPGEGVGAVLLKRLSQAVRDGDRIHAVVRASSVNHGGKTNGYTVPNPTAQAELIAGCLRKAGIDAGSIGYVEAHGTGTELGDPIEVAGLTEAFRHDTNDNGFCALGSVKSNIGHLEAAAGIAGLTKIVLQMRHAEIAPSLHARVLNPNIDFTDTPFVVQQELGPWRQGAEPRRAGLSSFGAGGANAHVVVEEYIAPEAHQPTREGPALIVLSARTGERLKQVAVDLLQFLEREALPLHDIAYTLQVGREAFRERLGVVASSSAELKQKLAQFIERGGAPASDDRLLDRWMKGETVDWSALYPGEKPRRVGLPGYPFARQRLWFDDQPLSAPVPADLLLLHPVWEAVAVGRETLPTTGAKVAIVGGTLELQQAIRQDFPDAVVADESTLGTFGRLDHVVWIASRSDVLSLFRLIKALLAHDYGAREFGLTVITTQALEVYDLDPNDATQAAVHGLAGSLAREYPGWQVRALDVAADAPWPVPGMWGVAPLRGESHAWRGEWLRQKLVRIPSLPRSAEAYRHGGVYVVVGGAGALGEVWTRMMVRDHQARVVWLGRSPLHSTIQAKLDALGSLGPRPDYIQADARDVAAMAGALRSIKAKHGAIHGLIVSTLGPYDQGLAQMSEALFRDILSSKRDVALCVADCFRDEPLDFIAYFSSMVAFGRPAGMAAYASACVFNDVFAHQLARERSGTVKVIDWGYWDAGGGGRISGALKSLVEHRGVQPIEAAQGLEALEAALGAPFVQLAVTRTSKPDLVETYDGEEQVTLAPPSSGSCIDALVAWRPSETVPKPGDAADELNGWIARLLHAQLKRVGQGARLAKYDRWWDESRNVLRQYGLNPDSAAADANDVWMGWRARKSYFLDHPETRTLAVLVEDCLRELPGILSGHTLVTDILFPNGSMEKIEGLYKDNAVCDYFNSIVAGAVETYIARRVQDDPAARIRLIEIGAGTGGTTSTILPRLKRWQRHIAEYCFTDLSRSFFNHARRRYGDDYPYLDYRLYDIERPLAEQGIAVGTYDIAIATNVLHATRRMRNTLRNAKAALSRNGLLILNEISDKTVFASVLFGLIDGWSLAEDEQWRIPGSPGLYPASWRSLLLQEGFTSVLFPAEPAHALGQQIVVAESDGVIRQRVSARSPEPQPAPVVEVAPAGADEDVQGAILDALASSLSIDREAIELDVAFSDYGVDSILGVGFVQQVNKALGLALATTVLFDHSTVARLVRHIGVEHRPAIASNREPVPAPLPSSTDGIAVIGMSGQFPGARNVEEFWRNMVGDVDPVVELPERYLERQAFSPQKQPGKSYCKWGGILETRDCFDPMFFNISPREAESMNPHQRLILLESWKALEDAGYNPKSLARSRTGVFVGCEPSAYVHETFTGASDAIVASRLSYFLDLNGPAFVVNTGCSSSGVALHLACEALRNNEADLALAGGAFAVMGQTILVGLSQTEMLSRGGRCRSFDADADGMVMSEGVGMVALKRLDQALADGDAIHGVIRASGTNQDGASNGITAPSGTAQQQLIADVYRRHGIDPERISYVEAHGTGTRLGDPVEANALVKAFRQFTSKTGYCAVGSSKSHIGHTSANAGVAGLISILLSLKHHRLPALRHFKTLNPLIEFEGSPFYPNTTLSDWRSTDGQPLMAALNSFGHSGTNVHLVVEEYVGVGVARPAAADRPELIVVSAKDGERLPEALGNLRAFICTTTASLADIAYTLQAGREALEHRAAFVVRNLPELDRLLTSVLSGDPSSGDAWTGHVGPRRKPAAALTANRRSLGELAAAWVQGADIDWASLARTDKPRRLHVPTYPFAQERYWKPNGQAVSSTAALLHPVVHRNVSTWGGLVFESCFTGDEFFFADHLVQGEKVLPGVVYLEMVRAALAHALGRGSQFEPVRFENIVWIAPLSPSTVTVAFEAPRAGAIAYRISSPAGLHHQGLVREAPPVASPPLDLARLRSAIGRSVGAETCYAALSNAGVQHGQVFKALRAVHVGNGQVLAKLEVAEPDKAYVLHPALMDAALQATIALALDVPGDRPVLLPFTLDALDVLGPCESVMWAWSRPGNGPEALDIDLCTEAGEVRVRLSRLTSRAVSSKRSSTDVTHFDGSEFFLKDHGGMLPAAVYLEMARAAAARQGGVVSALTNIVWPTPMMVGSEGGDLSTSLRPDGAFSMTCGTTVHCQGRAIFDEAGASSGARDIPAIQARCRTVLDKAACDALLRSTHGPSLLSIEHLRHNADEALALLELTVEQGDFHLPPSLLNGAILASVVWTLTGRPGADLPLPFSLDALRISGRLPPRLYAHVRRVSSAAAREVVDTDLLDLDGRCVASLERFTILFKEASEGTVFAIPTWVNRPLTDVAVPMAAPTLVLAERDDELQKATLAKWPDASIEVLRGPDTQGNLLHLFERCKTAAMGPLLLLIPDGPQTAFHNGLVGLLKTLRLEQPRTAAKAIRNARLVSQIAAEMAPSDDVEIRYDNDGRRHVRTLSEIVLADAASAFQPGDVVWITGGLGGIGRVVARHLGLAREARLILSGRSSLDADGQRFIDGLRRDGVEVMYLQVDVAEVPAVKAAVGEIERRFGRLQGIVHGAGTIEDDYIANKTADQVERVLRPKVAGTLALDDATRHLKPRYFILFSSIAGVRGNLGQADYAGANAFLDGFAQWRNENVGRTISINWPLWRDGGMRMGAASEELMRQATGMVAMDAESGARALEQCLASDRAQVLVAYGDVARIRGRLLTSPEPSPRVVPDGSPDDDLRSRLASSVRAELVRLVAEVQRIPPEKVSLQRDLSDYGFDSISFTEFANALNRTYALTLMPTLFFEIPDLEALADHLIAHHPRALLKKYALAASAVVATPAKKLAPVAVPSQAIDGDAIAVIGMAGKFPGAADPDELWRQLEANRDLIGEVPVNRWDWREIYGDPHTEPGKTRVKWGGFVADADCFDAAFFGISPAEAEAMDPQLRLFLETVWSALEDAGYPASALSGSRTGVFAGVATADYKELLAEARRNGVATSPAEPFPFMVANRVSYQFNFHGPSEVVDTACSSSLIAVHRAIESLRHGNCDVALAGGVNVMASPRITIASSQAGMLSEDGRCMTFDQRANGYVRSEGVAVLMLKPLGKAQVDGDRILGVIRASGENHGGRAASPTAPNAAAQKQLLVDVYSRAGIDPATIGYIEAHGTGTSLGDPVEVNGLKAAFAELYRLRGLEIGPVHCALGSVKANIGHLEAAAGAAGLIKVLLMLRHRRIPGNPQLRTPNPYLQLDGTPFHLVTETGDWAEGATPRRAGVSSFGVGGSNAHVVVEEYLSPASTPTKPSPVLIVLSAKDEQRLRDQAGRLGRFIADNRQTASLADLAYTLQIGREPMPCRLAFLATSLEEVVQGLLRAEVMRHDDGLQELSADEDMAATFDAWIAKGKHDKLLDAWLKGFRFDWARLHGDARPVRIGLPTYPFARERHWVPVGERIAAPKIPSDLRILQEVWSEESLAQGSGTAIETLLCITSDREHRQAIARWAAEGGDRPRVIFEHAAGDARADAVLYLQPLADPTAIADSFRIVDLLQQRPRKLILSGVHANEVERCHLDSWIGFGRSLGLVLPDAEVAVVFRDGASFAIDDWMRTLWAELQAPQLQSAWYREGARLVTRTQEIDLPADIGERPLRQGGVYLITGGCGGLGMICAEHLARTYAAKLLLTGRSAPDDEIESKLRGLRELGGEALYVPADVTDETAMREAVRRARAWGRLDGVLHVSGISGAASVLKAEAAGFKEVLAAKVEGTLVLERVLDRLDLDFVCYFSSSSAILGDFGSCDYAVANRFQTAYARGANRRIAINWPLWQGGGRGVGDAEQTRLYLESSGQRALTSSEGTRLFERLLAAGGSQYLVLTGAAPRPVPAAGDASLEECVGRDLKQEIHRLLKTRPEEILPRRNFVDFGFDSISLAEFSRVLSRFYALEISPSVFFSHSTLQRLTTYFITEHRGAMESFYARHDTPAAPLAVPPAVAHADPDEPIAIVGMSGRFPKARNVGELWQLLAEGVDAVEEIPSDRFDWRRYADKTSSRWGGFIPGIAEFDPLFFEISPLEAERMDPRQRHLLQEAWLALEDAGYGAAEIARQRIGMFVGVEEGSDYQRRQTEVSLTSTHNGVLASRLAYFLDLKGPVMAINTACSSGLVAAHTACQSLRQGECDTAIAAGVNLMVAPEAYVGMTQAGMLSPDGKCYVFDKRANGMVPGEAVAVVVLKRLSRALADGDPIHAVIRGSGINYDGRTNGITAPSGASQTELLRDVLARSRLDARDIDYIVTHGTGTRLGDPVEINALYDAFKPGNDRQGYCALTSIKSNLGHTFAASGLVSLIGLVQAMRHRTIPASLHCEQESDYIRWKESPFYVNKRAKPWVKEAGEPRIGAVSAFGISGTNAHMVVQEHVPEPGRNEGPTGAPCLLVLSARSANALQERIAQTIAFLQSLEAAQLDLASVSHTLLQGRYHFEHRSAVVARSLDEAVEAWRGSLDRRGMVGQEFTGEATVRREIEALAREVSSAETLQTLADHYCQGYDIPWQGTSPRRVSLPGYPFSRKRYWLDDRTEAPQVRTVSAFSYPEMARAAAEKALGQRVTALGNMVWGPPAQSSSPLSVRLHRADGDIAYSVGPEDSEGACFHLGEIVVGPVAVDRPYPAGKAEVSTLIVPTTEQGAGVLFAPSLVEAAWRVAGGALLPFALRRIESCAPLPAQVTLHLMRKEGAAPGQRTVDMIFLDAEGRVCLRLLDFTGASREQLIDLAVWG